MMSRTMKLGKKAIVFRALSAFAIPWTWTKSRCPPMKVESRAGRMATWRPKKRESVAPVTSSPPRTSLSSQWPTTGTWPMMSVPTLVAK
ncbi:MAG: hypothetical protein FD126_28 [Elusimicrobia bacterium]|nr:MAG: hypothetical protein FD126_28 [Elusimicrobiota bacterium]